MPPIFHPKLVNGPLDDPGLYIQFLFEKKALIFDVGETPSLSSAEILKLTHVFISHTHMDHFIGFDRILRLLLGRNKTLKMFGPEGFLKNVEGKLSSYTWNLVQHYTDPLILEVTEVHPDMLLTRKYPCADMFRPTPDIAVTGFSGVLHDEPSFSVSAILLDHRIPCLGFCVEEKFHINILKDRLDGMGLSVGPWLRELKMALYRKDPFDSQFPVPVPSSEDPSETKTFMLGELADKITRFTPGQKITYITDVGGSSENEEKIIGFAKNSDHLFIEAAFLESDRELADGKSHLTSHQAGRIARKAGVKTFSIFHFSPRYSDQEKLLEKEAWEAFEKG